HGIDQHLVIFRWQLEAGLRGAHGYSFSGEARMRLPIRRGWIDGAASSDDDAEAARHRGGQQWNRQQHEQFDTNAQRNPSAGARRHLRQLPRLERTAPAKEGDGGVDREQRDQDEQADLRVEQAVVQIVVQALAVAQGARRAGDQYQTGGDAEHQVDAKQAACALQGQRQAEQLMLQYQQCDEQEYRQKMQIGGDGVDHVRTLFQ